MRLGALLAAAALAAGCGDSGEERRPARSVPEGGSNLGSDVRAQERRAAPETSLVGALSAVLERAAPERTDATRRPRRVRTARDLAARLPRSRAAAQVLLAGFDGTDPGARFFTRLRALDLGGVVLEQRNFVDPVQMVALTGEVGVVARNAGHLPPLVAAEPIKGLRDPAALAAAGVRMTFREPVADVGPDAPYGDEPRDVRRRVLRAVERLRSAGIVAAPGHFPGQGLATQDPLQGPAQVGLPREELERRDLVPFRARLRAVIVSNAQYLAFDAVTPAAHLEAALGLLRRDLRFRGVAIADNVLGAAAATGGTPGEAAVAALRAGCDMVYVRDEEEREEVHRAILAALRRGTLPDTRLREAVRRVLELKAAARVV